MGSYVLPKGNSSKAREIRGSSTRQEDNCSCISRFSLYCVLVQPLWHITNFPYSQQSSITEYFQSHHKELLWTGKNLVLIIRAGWIIQLSSKANKRNMSWRCSSRSSNHSVCTETTWALPHPTAQHGWGRLVLKGKGQMPKYRGEWWGVFCCLPKWILIS